MDLILLKNIPLKILNRRNMISIYQKKILVLNLMESSILNMFHSLKTIIKKKEMKEKTNTVNNII